MVGFRINSSELSYRKHSSFKNYNVEHMESSTSTATIKDILAKYPWNIFIKLPVSIVEVPLHPTL